MRNFKIASCVFAVVLLTVTILLLDAAMRSDSKLQVAYESRPQMEVDEDVDAPHDVTYGAGDRSSHWPTVMHRFKMNERWVKDDPRQSTTESLDDRAGRWEVDTSAGVDNGSCRCCGRRDTLNVHHIKPFHIDESLELEFDNLVTLCREHHFHIGHKDNWKDSNSNVCGDCDRMRAKLNPNKAR